ncbi:MAG TPA: BolA/IbaG family iron-sulfur metabolism protein [Polyangiaceae bacterium]|nr:BolA/IbaG family iron-sulfur metabolism protein [Polyangiaceae bacterium]
MTRSLGSLEQNIAEQIRKAIVEKLPGAVVDVSGAGGHFTLVVKSEQFAGKTPLAAQRLVYSAIAPLMAGEGAPVHAIDNLKTIVE